MRDVAAGFREYARLDRKRAAQGLDPAELRRWSALKQALGQIFSPDLSDHHANARESVRVPARLRVSFASMGELQRSLMTNLSRGGLFVATQEVLEIGARLQLRLNIEETETVLEVPVEVVSQNVGPDFASDQHGMGMRFLDLDDATRKQIDALYERKLKEAAQR
jgi:uncharacterized protein (TIGR02266 family)